ncbi:MAG TPA: PTS sugar transporter subunit IIC [Elusimicrobiales bacterium]|nr:PTS sugar transporter subunit IIC [Elusimicrobiales bacterium]
MDYFTLFATAAAAGLLQLDNVQFLQSMVSRPLAASLLFGLICGCPGEAARLGLLTELIYSDYMPMGGSLPPNGVTASAVGVLGVSSGVMSPGLAFFAGLAAGYLYSGAEFRLRTIRSGWNGAVEEALSAGRPALGRRLAASLAMESAAVFVYVSVLAGAIAAAGAAGADLLFLAPPAELAYAFMPWLGLSALYFRFRTQTLKK